MKVSVFNGSPRAEKSNSHRIASAFLKGAERAGAEINNVFLIHKNIKHCTGCFKCWFESPGKCIFDDDMTELLKEYQSSDIVVFATPVYTWNMTAALKNFADRLIPLLSPILTQKNGNFDLENSNAKVQKSVVIANSGFPGEKNFQTIRAVFQSCNPVLEIYRNSGKILEKRDHPVYGKVVNEYLNQVEQAGFELVNNQQVSAETKAELDKDLLSTEEYVQFLGMKA